MIPKKGIQTLAFCLAQAVVVYATAAYFGGPYLRKVIPLASAILFSGVTVFFALLVKGRKSDQECDERENLISEKATKFSFYIMSLVLLSYWAYDVSLRGTFTGPSVWLLYLFWSSYLVAYAANKLRF